MNAADERKAQVLERMQRQREHWLLLREQRAAAPPDETDDTFPRSSTFRFLLRNPALAAAAVGVVIAAGPARLVRWGAWLLPLLMRR